jgi:hypothetical protein
VGRPDQTDHALCREMGGRQGMGRAPVRLRQAVTEGERPFWGKSLKRNQTILFPACTSEDTRREC